MAKIALITDTHFGVRSDSQLFASYIGRFYKEVFFPYLDAHNIRIVRHLGDIMDRRKYVNYLTVRNLRDQFIMPCIDRKIDLGILIGNHDTFYKNTNALNSMNELFGGTGFKKFKWFAEPTEETIDGTKILMMPWICPENYEQSFALVKKTNAQILFGHLELAGFEMYRGSASDHGYDSKLFDKFELVCSGHFHHKSTYGNINYLGAPYEMTWSDFDDTRGFHVFDTDTRELTYIENPLKMYHKIYYNDSTSLEEVLKLIDFELKDCYVKLIVKERNNQYWFDMIVDKLQNEVGVADLRIIDDQLQLDIEGESEIINEAEDTITMIKKFAAGFMQDKNPDILKELNNVLISLYTESLATMEKEQ